MIAYRWAYCKIIAWALWRILDIRSPSAAIWGVSRPVMFNGAGDFRDHRYGGATLQACADYDAILRKAMERE